MKKKIDKTKARNTSLRGKAIKALSRESEEKYQSILDNMQDGYFEADLSGNFTFINDSMARFYGYSKDEMTGMNYRQCTDEKNAKKILKTFSNLYKSGNPIKEASWQLIGKGGSKRYVIGSASLISDSSGKPLGFKGVVHDVTDRRNVQESFRQSEFQYRLLADHMKDQIWLMDFNFKFFYASPSVKKLWGYTLDEINNISWDKALVPESLEKVLELVSNMPPITVDSPDNILDRSVEVGLHCKDGRIVWEEIRCDFVRDDNGKAVSILGVGRDVTERKQMENELKKGEKRYRSVFENAGLPLIIIDESLLILMVNDRFAEMSGYETKEIEGKMKLTYFLAPEDQNAIMECLSRRREDTPVEYETRIAHKNTGMFDVLIRIGRVSEAEQFIASFTDITTRKQAEIALRESRESLQKENIRLRTSIRERYRFRDIIGKSRSMQEVYEFILQAAATQANVIIYGESGTGKELVAKAIHETSDRSRKSFVTVHCGAIPETLMESEFFGYQKGAFTGAGRDKRGYLDEADGGTLFLDEVGEISMNMQVKLLRAISGDGYTPVGGNLIKNADVRIIAATNRNLRDLVKQGKMREDFFYRIHILPIYLPPLRKRKEDLPLLVDYFMRQNDKKHPPLPGNIAEALLNYDWPGNVRELQNVLHRYLTLKRLDFEGMPAAHPVPVATRRETDRDALNGAASADTANGSPAETEHNHSDSQKEKLPVAVDSFERDHIIKALSENKWHRDKTARALGISRKTLFRKMKKFSLI